MQDDSSSGLAARPALEFSYIGLADAFNRCFEGYIVPFNVNAESLERRFRSETTDLAASRVYTEGDRVAAIVLVNRRGLMCRIGAFAISPERRGAGLGSRVMREVISEARSRGDRTMVLEVIEQNVPAVGLYRKLGFGTLRRLVGYRLENAPGDDEALKGELEEVDAVEFSRVAVAEGEGDLPWMLAPETLAGYSLPSQAYSLSGKAFALIGDTSAERVALVALVVPRKFRRRGWGDRMVRALFAEYPGHKWSVMQIVPEDLAPGFFDRLGFTREDLTQLEMRLTLRQQR